MKKAIYALNLAFIQILLAIFYFSIYGLAKIIDLFSFKKQKAQDNSYWQNCASNKSNYSSAY